MKLNTLFRRILTLVIALLLLDATVSASSNSDTANRFALGSTGRTHSLRRTERRKRGRTFDVQHYLIKTRFDFATKTVVGEVEVTLKPLSSGFNTVDLDATNMKIERVTLTDGTRLRSIIRPDILRIILNRSYSPAESITLRINYKTSPRRGLYFVPATRSDGYQRPQQIWTQGEPEDNHYWFPCYDFPDDKVTSEQYITTRANEIAIANGTLVKTIDNQDGTRTFHWRMDQLHSTYLISLIVGDYARVTDTYNNVALEYYTYRGTVPLALRAFNDTPAMMRWFSNVLGYDFPFDRYAQTVVGDFIFGGMENVTATTFADSEIFDDIDPATDSSTINLVSHELAHSWFGNLVTSNSWAHLWLNEGFATFLEASYREGKDGREAYLSEMKKNATDYFEEDPSRNRHPLANPGYVLTRDLFDATTYKKGAFVIHMLRETVGDEVFWKALNVYLNEFKYRTVESSDLQNVFERVSGQSLEWFFDQWVFKAGYPELRVRATYFQSKQQLTVSITQVHKPDTQTPVAFRLPLELEIETGFTTRTEQINVNRRKQDFVFQLDGKPRSVIIDKRARVLKKLTVPQSQLMIGFAIRDGFERLEVNNAAGAFLRRHIVKIGSLDNTLEKHHSTLLDMSFATSLFDHIIPKSASITN